MNTVINNSATITELNLCNIDSFGLVKLLKSDLLSLDLYTKVRQCLASSALCWDEYLTEYEENDQYFIDVLEYSPSQINDVKADLAYAYMYMFNNGFTLEELKLMGKGSL